MLSALGGTVGVLLASWLVRLFVSLAPTNSRASRRSRSTRSVLVFTLALATLTGMLFGLAPARRGFRADPNESLRDMGARAATSGGARGASRFLVVAEVALALMLVVGAGLMVKSLLTAAAGAHRVRERRRDDLRIEPAGCSLSGRNCCAVRRTGARRSAHGARGAVRGRDQLSAAGVVWLQRRVRYRGQASVRPRHGAGGRVPDGHARLLRDAGHPVRQRRPGLHRRPTTPLAGRS